MSPNKEPWGTPVLMLKVERRHDRPDRKFGKTNQYPDMQVKRVYLKFGGPKCQATLIDL